MYHVLVYTPLPDGTPNITVSKKPIDLPMQEEMIGDEVAMRVYVDPRATLTENDIEYAIFWAGGTVQNLSGLKFTRPGSYRATIGWVDTKKL